MKLTKNLKMRLLVIFVFSYVFSYGYKIDTYCAILQNSNGTTQIRNEANVNQTNFEEDDEKECEIKLIGAVNSDYITQVEQNLELIPEGIMEKFVADGWEFYITTSDINEEYFDSKYYKVCGVTLYNEKCIKVAAEKDIIDLAVIHEMGHYFDYLSKFSSSSEEFKQIYQSEVKEFEKRSADRVLISNEREFFAQIFYYSIKDSSKCTPRALKYVKNQLEIFLKTMGVQLNTHCFVELYCNFFENMV